MDYHNNCKEETQTQMGNKSSSMILWPNLRYGLRYGYGIKVTFKERKDLVDAINDRINIFQQRYIIEEFKPSPRVI